MDTTKPPPQPTLNNQPFQKWMMEATGIIIFLLSKIAESLSDIATGSKKAKLRYRGQMIIMFDEILAGMNLSKRTGLRMRSSNKLEHYISRDGNLTFCTQEQFDDYIDRCFVRSNNTEAESVRKSKCNANQGANQ